MVISGKGYDWSLLKDRSAIVYSAALFLLSIAVVATTSHSIPLSLDSLFFTAVALCIFFHFFVIKSNFLHQSFSTIVGLLLPVALGLFSLLFIMFPQLGSLLHSINIFYPTFGHTHLVAILVLFTPLSWTFAIEQFATKKEKIYLLLPLFFSFLYLISFSRLAIIILIAQLLLLYRCVQQSFIAHIVRSLLLILVGLLMGFAYLSVRTQENCPFIRYSQQLCKPLKVELRSEYWRQALSAFKEYPITGYGPGSFQLISQRYKSVPHANTLFAHNVFLQMFAEGGVVMGSAYLLFIGSLYQPLWKICRLCWKRKKINRAASLAIGLWGVLVIASFDFDWNIFGVFVISLAFMALVLRDTHAEETKKLPLSGTALSIVPFLYYAVLIGIASIVCTFIVTSALISAGREELAFNIFPFFSSQKTMYVYSKHLSEKQQISLKKIYYFDLMMLNLSGIKDKTDTLQKISISPWDLEKEVLSDDFITASISLNDQFPKYIAQIASLLIKNERNKKYIPRFESKAQVAHLLIVTSRELYDRGELIKSTEFLAQACMLDPWGIDKNEFFLSKSIPLEVNISFVALLRAVPTECFGNQKLQYAYFYTDIVVENFSTIPSDKLALIIKRIGDFDANTVTLLLRKLTPEEKKEVITILPELAEK